MISRKKCSVAFKMVVLGACVPALLAVACGDDAETTGNTAGNAGRDPGHQVGGGGSGGGGGGGMHDGGRAGVGVTAGIGGTGVTPTAGRGGSMATDGATAGQGGDGGDAGSSGSLAGNGGGGEPAMHGDAGAAGSLGEAGAGATKGDGGAAGAGNTGPTPLPDFSSPSSVQRLSETPDWHDCTEDRYGELAIYPATIYTGDGEKHVTELGVCQDGGLFGGEWHSLQDSETSFFDYKVDATWAGVLKVAKDGKYVGTMAFWTFEGDASFLTLGCTYDHTHLSQSGFPRGDANAPEVTICDQDPGSTVSALGTFKARFIGGAPTVTFYPKGGGAALPLSMYKL